MQETSSIGGRDGRVDGSEPVAIMIFLLLLISENQRMYNIILEKERKEK